MRRTFSEILILEAIFQEIGLKFNFFLWIIICHWICAQPTPYESFYYSYNLHGKQIGYAEVSYQSNDKDRVFHKKKIKFRKILGDIVQEEHSAILNPDYTLRSAYLTSEDTSGKKFWIITVTDRIVIQSGSSITTLTGQTLYLEIEDFLRYLAAQALVKNKIYNGAVLAMDWKNINNAKARYLEETSLSVEFQTYAAKIFKVHIKEFNEFWAMAWIHNNGRLLGYQLGDFEVFAVPRRYALQILQTREPLPMPVVFDTEQIRSLRLKFPPMHAKLYPNGQYQIIDDQHIVLNAIQLPDVSISLKQIDIDHLQHPLTIPVSHPLIVKYAPIAKKNAVLPLPISENVATWVYHHMTQTRTSVGKELSRAFGMSRDTPALVTQSLCRANGIPSRVVAGLVYSPGQFCHETWAEIYLNKWIPLYRGTFGKGACFLQIFPDTTWTQREIPSISLILQSAVKKDQKIEMNIPDTCFVHTQDKIEDRLLGISCTQPQNWKIAAKDMWSDSLLFESATGNIMLLKVFQAPKSLSEILASFQKKVDSQDTLQILWQQHRVFPEGSGLEVAVSSKGDIVYRAFVAEKNNKGIFLLLIVSTANLVTEEVAFQSLISSLHFLEDK